MTQFAYPILNLFVGFALSLYGLIHSAKHVPASTQLHAFWAAMPSLVAVLIFLFGIVAVGGGLSLFASGMQGLKKRKRQIARIYGRQHEPFEDEEDGHPAYYR